MSNLAAVNSQSQLQKIEQVLIGGDLSSLTEGERLAYYKKVCETLDLNPLTKPFEFIRLNGKLVMYAVKACTDQLRSNRKVSITIKSRENIAGCYVVTACAKLPDGREDESTGAVDLTNLKGDNLANAMMKAETKSKRRVTLSICGLGMLDETEVADIPQGPQPGDFKIKPHYEEGNGITDAPKGYVIDFGQWRTRTLEDVYRNFGPEKMASYITFLEESAAKKGQSPTAAAQKFIEEAEAFLGAMENAPLEPQA